MKRRAYEENDEKIHRHKKIYQPPGNPLRKLEMRNIQRVEHKYFLRKSQEQVSQINSRTEPIPTTMKV